MGLCMCYMNDNIWNYSKYFQTLKSKDNMCFYTLGLTTSNRVKGRIRTLAPLVKCKIFSLAPSKIYTQLLNKWKFYKFISGLLNKILGHTLAYAFLIVVAPAILNELRFNWALMISLQLDWLYVLRHLWFLQTRPTIFEYSFSG